MVTARCTRGLTAGTSTATDCSDGFGHSADNKRISRTTATTDVACHCLDCCYVTAAVTVAPQPAVVVTTRRNSGKTPADESSGCEPPSEAAAFVASASAAAFVLLAALLAVVLSSAALLTVASMVPMADAAARELRGPQAADYIHLWHQQQQHKQQPAGQRLYDDDDDASRQKRQLFNKNANREPGVVALTFSLIGGTISDAREAFRNVSSIVRDTINEAASDPAASSTAAGDQMMMAAANTADNEIGGGAASTTVAADPRMAGQTIGKLLGRNYRGLRRLFNSELRSAVKNSPGNIRDFAVELMGSIGQSLRPQNLFSRGQINDTTTAAGRR